MIYNTLPRYEERALGLPYPVILENAAEELLDKATGARIGVRIGVRILVTQFHQLRVG